MLVSVVIPARPGEDALAGLLQQLPPHRDVQVIVSFAGPLDAPARALQQARRDIVWVEGLKGRGPQLNAGAARASGAWLWFVHADSRLPEEWFNAFRRLPDVPAIVGGSFGFALDSPAWQARVVERGVAWRVRWLGLPYGDQGIFVRREVFSRMGGFAAIPLMEDVEFIGRLTRSGTLRHLTLQVVTSARRWQRDGWWKRSALNLVYLGLYRLGAPPEWLATRYDRTYGDQTDS